MSTSRRSFFSTASTLALGAFSSLQECAWAGHARCLAPLPKFDGALVHDVFSDISLAHRFAPLAWSGTCACGGVRQE
ncbi:MAG: hypothetical protein ACR2G6_10715 [Gemmatimonadaceae bacterium]